ncbi:HipA domain-containing protein [Adlercreutzia sp. ZJ473]|uniref:HipA domain-containing protein n=1 Tax=Adlercreutzia sp. ZJ473 TaxID=2722822 RepID=UPI001552D0D5|nr:HipA domain-containing protein [Adlercreutzia sp. ZJ473]
MDFTSCELSNRYYGGTERKIGVIVGDEPFMLKFQKRTAFGVQLNHLSEHLGSRVFACAGIPSQYTVLGTYKGEPVVACRDFLSENEQFVSFNDVGESTLDQDKETYQYEYADIMRMLRDNSKLTDVEGTVAAFWEIFIIDALIGNFDRHGGNWGFVKHAGRYRLAPVFDNGSCLFPSLLDDQMARIIASDEETRKRVFDFPTSQVKLDGRKSSYYEVISSLAFPECNKALANVVARLDMDAVRACVADLADASETRRLFYTHMLDARYELILRSAYEKLMGGRS